MVNSCSSDGQKYAHGFTGLPLSFLVFELNICDDNVTLSFNFCLQYVRRAGGGSSVRGASHVVNSGDASKKKTRGDGHVKGRRITIESNYFKTKFSYNAVLLRKSITNYSKKIHRKITEN